MQSYRKLTAVAIDDNLEFLSALERMVEKTGLVKLAGTASTVRGGIDLISNHKPDLVFLDVELPGGSGFDIITSFDEIDFRIIFTTAHEHYALKAIKFSAVDYLLKPFGEKELESAIQKLHEYNYFNSTPIEALLNNLAIQSSQLKKLGLHTQEGVYFIELKDIVRCKAEGNYTEFHMINRKMILVSTPIKKYTDLLTGLGFYRVHNSHLINLNHVLQFARVDGGVVIMSDGASVDVSRNRKAEFLELFKQL